MTFDPIGPRDTGTLWRLGETEDGSHKSRQVFGHLQFDAETGTITVNTVQWYALDVHLVVHLEIGVERRILETEAGLLLPVVMISILLQVKLATVAITSGSFSVQCEQLGNAHSDPTLQSGRRG